MARLRPNRQRIFRFARPSLSRIRPAVLAGRNAAVPILTPAGLPVYRNAPKRNKFFFSSSAPERLCVKNVKHNHVSVRVH
jgi:hypothetical protein